MILCARRMSRSRELSTKRRSRSESMRIVWLSNMENTFLEKFTRRAKGCGLFSWLCWLAERANSVVGAIWRHWLIESSSFPVNSCMIHSNLTEADRNENFTKRTPRYPVCDFWTISPGWYRFTGNAGDMMATLCVPMRRCNTHATGWMNGSHPTIAEGTVTRRVCFHWSGNCCRFQVNVRVKNCGRFYVYYLVKSKSCFLRYCSKKGTAWLL